mmetsp:Transcript_18338/g.45700  ORF Transcript_18338/g.45700 Transcript_18338/m.45700 type:complete len:94 (-) Transcript_18338:68-349(-)
MEFRGVDHLGPAAAAAAQPLDAEDAILAALGAPPAPPLELGPSFLLKKASILNLKAERCLPVTRLPAPTRDRRETRATPAPTPRTADANAIVG